MKFCNRDKFIDILLLISPIFFFSCHSEGSHHHEEEEEEHEHSGIEFEPEKAAEFGIEYEIIAPGSFHDVIKTTGQIEAATSDVYTITAKKSGIVTLIPGISLGSEVKAGERIGTISTEGLQGGDVSQAAISNLETAKAEYERLKPLYEEGLVTASVYRESERVYKEAQALAGKSSTGGSAVLTSPSQGTLQSLLVSSGQFVDAGTAIAIVSKNSNLTLKADLPTREARHLSELESANLQCEGSDQVIKLADYNGKKISGTSSAALNGYIPVYFSFVGSPLSFPGGFAEVYLICGERQGVISVPRDALVEIQGNKYLYVAEDDHHYEKRLVKTGATDGERVELTDGVEPGEKIVSKGASIIRMAEVSSIAPPAHTHNH